MNRQRVLVLDDHEAILAVVNEALHYEQFEVLSIREGRYFLAALAFFRPDLILLDYRLADCDGGDLCRQLKTLEAYRHIPVIIFSAYFSPGEVLPADCDGFLYKPFDLTALFTQVRRFLPLAKEIAS